jgi:hypothetical protein
MQKMRGDLQAVAGFHIVAERVLRAGVDAPAVARNALPELGHDYDMMQPLPSAMPLRLGRRARLPGCQGVMAGQEHVACPQQWLPMPSGQKAKAAPATCAELRMPVPAQAILSADRLALGRCDGLAAVSALLSRCSTAAEAVVEAALRNAGLPRRMVVAVLTRSLHIKKARSFCGHMPDSELTSS